MQTESTYVPALGHARLTPLYDLAAALLTREGAWRRHLLAQMEPRPRDVILDVGCGTGTFAIMLRRASRDSRIVALDPDPAILARARAKAEKAGAAIEWREGLGQTIGAGCSDLAPTKIVSSLVFHQILMPGKRATLKAMFDLLREGGELHIADYGLQRSALSRLLFRQVQNLDGYEPTTPSAEGLLPVLMEEVGFEGIRENKVIITPTGSISLYIARKP